MSIQGQECPRCYDFNSCNCEPRTRPTSGGFETTFPEEVERDMAIHEAVESILKLYRTIGKESAHWICTSAIIAGEREAARNANA